MLLKTQIIQEDELIGALGTGSEGTSTADMVAVAQKHGFRVRACPGWNLNEVKKTVKAGDPVIVLLQAWSDRYMTIGDWRSDHDDGHYAIVIGFAKRVILFEDPASFRRTWLSEREFLARWHDRDTRTNEILEHFGMFLMGRQPVKKTLKHMD